MFRHAVPIALLAAALLHPATPAADSPFVVETLLDGVWLFRAPAHSATHTNSLAIERDRGLFVVEAQPSPQAARDLLKAIAGVSQKPVDYLLLTHAHVESTGGATAFPESTTVIASLITHEALRDETLDLAKETRARSADPDSWSAPPRVALDLIITSGTQVADGPHLIEILPLHGGHYPGSLIVRIKAADFYYVGATISGSRNPFADLEHSDIGDWVSSLNSLSLLKPKTVVPLRGAAINAEQLRGFRDSLVWALGQIEDAFIEGVDADEVLTVAMDSPRLGEYFDLEVQPSFVTSVFETAWRAALVRYKRKVKPD
ncbi:MAG: MBL fold metallo-hydrolase [Acidobacteria bacterium]|nr:MBL fold metallo-hydrolase [Acidobacteriota bacterium]NIM64228.1 MBL fold metallo-hydrolase [Acidobacteriota bacterium]NIO59226.1 MBL fold metallo-hydrolase [Acidobacteriota bacterium]NIQ30253.1 MBL fold metallo-hydrolase [Acidobacteriota bacterium]NIQ85181.1 MBL fold metallo-hydrolase [Acidobacteriota bacterium]